MKRLAPPKNPAEDAKPRPRRPYPTDVTSPESNAEFLRCIADLFYERANEVERGAARKRAARPESKERK